MPDREKVIKGLECLTNDDPYMATIACDEKKCPYAGIQDCNLAIWHDALELLKQDGCENCAMAVEDRQMVVRCKDCRWWEDGRCENDYVHQQIYDDGCYPDFHTDSEWFCAEGERR